MRAASGDALADPGAQARGPELFLGVWAGEIENDGLNRLVLRVGLDPRQVVVLRALVKYLHQAGLQFTEASFADTLARRTRIRPPSSTSTRPAPISTSGQVFAHLKYLKTQFCLGRMGRGPLLDPGDFVDELGDLSGNAGRLEDADHGDRRLLASSSMISQTPR